MKNFNDLNKQQDSENNVVDVVSNHDRFISEIKKEIYDFAKSIKPKFRSSLHKYDLAYGPLFDMGDSAYLEYKIIYDFKTNFLKILEEKDVIKKFGIIERVTGKIGSPNHEELIVAKITFYPNKFIQYYKDSKKGTIEKVKKVELDEETFSLIIDGGDRFISFRSKKTKKTPFRPLGLSSDKENMVNDRYERETKKFKVLCILWDHRKEIKRGKNVRKTNDFITSDPLLIGTIAKNAGCSVEAVRQHIKRIREKLHGLPISVWSSNTGLYQLIVNLG